jgi:hypothetical protein
MKRVRPTVAGTPGDDEKLAQREASALRVGARGDVRCRFCHG